MDEIGGGIVIDSDDFGSMKDGKLTVSNDHQNFTNSTQTHTYIHTYTHYTQASKIFIPTL